MRLWLVLGLAGWFVTAGAATAQMSIALKAMDLVDAKVDYQADYSLVSGGSQFHGKLIHAPRCERWEFGPAGAPQVLLLRRDLDQAAMLWPLRHWYMSARFSTLSAMLGGLDGEILQGREAGLEKINGEMTVRYHVDHGAFIGDLWRSQDGILLKAAGKVIYNGQPTVGELVLSNVRRVKADPALFVRPADYIGIPFDAGK